MHLYGHTNEYLERISRIFGDDVTDGDINLNLRWTDREQARGAMAQVRSMQTELRQLKKEVIADASSKRSGFTSKRTAIGKSFSGASLRDCLGARRWGE